MSDITFSCPHCQNPLVVDEEGAGLEIPCPVCSRQITIPEASEVRPEPEPSPLEGLPLSEDDLDRLALEILRRSKGGTGGQGARIVKNNEGGRDIAFNCPRCDTHLVVDIAGAGLEISCPNCSADIGIPDPVRDAETFLASALASRLGLLSEPGATPEIEAPATQEAPLPTTEKAPEPVVPAPASTPSPALAEEAGRTRIPLKPKIRSKKAPDPVTTSSMPFLLPQTALGEGGVLPQDLAKATEGGGYVIVPIQTPNGPAAMITQAPQPGADSTTRNKRPRYPRKYSDLAAKLKSAEPAEAERSEEAMEELQKRGPLVSRVLAQHFIEKALEQSSEDETEAGVVSEEDAAKASGPLGHKGALKSPQRVELKPEAAALPRVEPVGQLPASHQKPQKSRSHGRHGHGHGHGHRGVKRGTILTVVGLVALLATLAALSYSFYVDGAMSRSDYTRAPRVPQQDPRSREKGLDEPVTLPILELRTAEAAVRTFCQAPTWEDLIPLIRDRERVEPLLREYYATHPYKPARIQEIRNTQAAFSKGMLIVSAQAITEDNYQEIPVLMSREDEGYMVDWEFVVEYNPLSWEEFRAKKPSEPIVFRTLLSPAEYYNFQFADSKVYQCFKIDDRQLGFVGVYAYVKRDTPVSDRLEQEMRQTLPLPCMVTLQFPSNPEADNLVEITEFLRKGWMVEK